MASRGIPGASITIIRNGQVVLNRGFGTADLENRVAATPETRFRIGSVSKPLTSIALGLLVDEGRLDLDAPVQRYVPGFPAKRWPITVRQVAGHLAGIRHYREGEFGNQRPYPTLTDGLRMFQDDSLLFEPGSRFAYSSFGWNLLGAVIEGASGQPYLTFMRDRVLVPLGLSHTIADFPDSLIPSRAQFYTRADSTGPIVNAPFVDNSYKWPGGGYLSTTEDLARWGAAMIEGKLLRRVTRDLLWSPMTTRDGKSTGYGIGWTVRSDSLGRRQVYHTGGSMGGTAILLLYPEQHLTLALLVNSDRTLNDLASRIARWYLDDARLGDTFRP
jgi:CubicO group peptidase (beta-lactamase class C family)